MKTFSFDERGNLTVKIATVQTVEGQQVENITQHDIQPGQIKAHLPMFEADMTAAERAQAQAIIAAQAALNG